MFNRQEGRGAPRLFARLFLSCAVLVSVIAVPAHPADIPCEWNGIEKVVAIGDLHGDYEHCLRILQGTGLIDDGLRWSGGKTHLVQMGDIMDRGARARDIFDLMMRIENEARKMGGRVHVLIGNHEEANLLGTALDMSGYMSWEQFISFLPDSYRKKMEKKLKEEIRETAPSKENGKAVEKKFWTRLMVSDQTARSLYMENFIDPYGRWLLKKNLVIRINDVVFTHGGINEEFSTWKIKEINKRARLEIKAMMRGRAVPRKIVYVENAPQWFRGLIKLNEDEFSDDLDRILANLGVRAIVVGHTVRRNVEMDQLSRFQGRVWGIDTGISGYYKGRLSALIIENGVFSVWGEE